MKSEKILLLFGLFVLMGILQAADSSGFTVTSISTSDVITKTTEPSRVYWIINTHFNGGGQYLTGTVNPQDVKALTGGRYYTRQPLQISAETAEEEVIYNVINEGVPIYKYEIQTLDGLKDCPLGVCYYYQSAPSCPSGTTWDIPMGSSFFGYIKKRVCVTKMQAGVKGAYSNPTIGFNAKISVIVGSTRKEKTICSGSTPGCEGSSVSFDDLGVASWTGSLVTGEPAPNQDNFVAIKSLDSNEWTIARRSSYDAYIPVEGDTDGHLNEFVSLYSASDFNDDAELESAIENIYATVSLANQKTDLLLSEDASFTSSPFTKDDNTGKVVVTLERSLLSPNVVFRIRADWLGIVIPTGEPRILNINAVKVTSGEEGRVDVQVQNVGEAAGTFSAMLQDCEPFIQSSTSQTARKTFQPNDIDTLQIFVSGGTLSEDLTKSCTVKVYDVNDPSIYTTSGVTLQLEKAKICAPGNMYAEGNTVKQCNSDGTAINIVETCDYGVITDGRGGLTCASAPRVQAPGENISSPYVSQCNYDSDCRDTEYCQQTLHVCVQKSGCLEVQKKGDSNAKIDVVFVGDGYNDNEELKQDILFIVDYYGTNNGLMSVEPFKTGRDKFNIWMIKTGNQIPAEESWLGTVPERGKALEMAGQCSAAEYQVILSKKRFRSFAYFTGDTYISLGATDKTEWGRLVLHEFGHSFGKLKDEYIENGLGDWPGQPNCAPDTATARAWWGSIPGIGYYQGCSYTEDNIRPTFNSIMRAQWLLNYDYEPVNEAALQRLMNNYR